jgi:3-hydroxyacyl-CoA dehydrogenase
MALGGGAELAMGGVEIVAHAELYAGLVEAGVGLIPAGGGLKELVRREINPLIESSPNADVLPHLQKIFEAVATANVTESAMQARDLGFLTENDHIVMNRDLLLGEAKRIALSLADGYVPRTPGRVWASGRDAYAALMLGIQGFLEGNYASEHDSLIAKKAAWVLTGGGLAEPQWVSEDYMLAHRVYTEAARPTGDGRQRTALA